MQAGLHVCFKSSDHLLTNRNNRISLPRLAAGFYQHLSGSFMQERNQKPLSTDVHAAIHFPVTMCFPAATDISG